MPLRSALRSCFVNVMVTIHVIPNLGLIVKMVYTQVLEINIYNNNDDVLKNQDEDEIVCG